MLILLKVLAKPSADFQLKKKLFTYFWLNWVSLAVCGLSIVVMGGGATLRGRAQASPCSGVSCHRARAPGTQWLWCLGLVARGVWGLPRPGIEPVSPALAGGFLITGSPGKSYRWTLRAFAVIGLCSFICWMKWIGDDLCGPSSPDTFIFITSKCHVLFCSDEKILILSVAAFF